MKIEKSNMGNKEQDTYRVAPLPERLSRHVKVLILTDDKVEDIEFFYPYYRLTEAGYQVDVVTEDGGSFEGKHGLGLKETLALAEVNADDYALLYLPGGKAPARLRESDEVLEFVKNFAGSGRPIAAVCHGAQILAAADLINGKHIAAWPAIKGEIEEVGATFVNEALVEDGQFITARMPGDLHRHLNGVLNYLRGENQPASRPFAA